jgi:hypothetical protein
MRETGDGYMVALTLARFASAVADFESLWMFQYCVLMQTMFKDRVSSP